MSVHPEESPPALKKPIKLKPPLTHWDAAYLKRKEEVGEKFFTCKSGRKYCYFTDGSADPSNKDVPVVLCLHGAVQQKCAFILTAPLTNIFMIVPDRMGSGASSSTPKEGYSFEDGCKELLELVDAVYADRNIPKEKKFFVAGHSMGGTFALSMGACPETRDRIEAIASISSPCDVNRMTAQERKKLKEFPGFLMGLQKKGCGGCCSRCLFWNVFYKLTGDACKGQTGDYGTAAQYDLLRKHTGGNDKSKDAMDANPFFVCGALDSFRGFNEPHDSFNEWSRCYGAEWSYDTATFNNNVPCFIYNGENEAVDKAMAEFHHKQIEHSELILWPHGHLSIALEYQGIIETLVKGKKLEEPCVAK